MRFGSPPAGRHRTITTAAIRFHESDPSIPVLQKAWVEGHRTVATFSEEEENEIPTFIMLRRILLTPGSLPILKHLQGKSWGRLIQMGLSPWPKSSWHSMAKNFVPIHFIFLATAS